MTLVSGNISYFYMFESVSQITLIKSSLESNDHMPLDKIIKQIIILSFNVIVIVVIIIVIIFMHVYSYSYHTAKFNYAHTARFTLI